MTQIQGSMKILNNSFHRLASTINTAPFQKDIFFLNALFTAFKIEHNRRMSNIHSSCYYYGVPVFESKQVNEYLDISCAFPQLLQQNSGKFFIIRPI
jgi:hypothetical protein